MRANSTPMDRFEVRLVSSCEVSAWCDSSWKRAWDIFGAILLLILLLPLMIIVALAVKLTSPGPILFRQQRPGKNGREFTILKFRTMRNGRNHAGPMLTRALDPRVTWVGGFMRKWKLDELPQIWNVLSGHMSLVGPRPQPTKLWKQPSIREEAARVLSVRPGITSDTTLKFRNEEELLAPFSLEEVEEVYMRGIMPVKLRMDLDYLRSASCTGDLQIFFRTVVRVFHRQAGHNDFIVKEYLPHLEKQEYLSAAEEAN